MLVQTLPHLMSSGFISSKALRSDLVDIALLACCHLKGMKCKPLLTPLTLSNIHYYLWLLCCCSGYSRFVFFQPHLGWGTPVYSLCEWGEAYPVWLQMPHQSSLLPGLLTYSQSSTHWQPSLGWAANFTPKCICLLFFCICLFTAPPLPLVLPPFLLYSLRNSSTVSSVFICSCFSTYTASSSSLFLHITLSLIQPLSLSLSPLFPSSFIPIKALN